ncbi:MAG: hypothetical protein Q7J48_01575 [Nocardioides sp.]|nr:hypothetical protein [Nocardioides sp.]
MRRPLLGAVAALALLLGGCADDEEPDADPSPAPSASDTGSPSPTPTPSETTPAAPEATGPMHETSAFTIRGATPDYVSRVVSGDEITALSDLRVGDNVYFSVKQDYDDFTLEELAAVYDGEATYVGSLTRLPDTEVDGQPAVHLSGKASSNRHAEVFIMLRDGVVVEIDFEMLSDEPDRSQAIASMLGSFAWK